MKSICVFLLCIGIAGCSFPNQIVVTSTGASGQYIPFADAKVGGCSIATKGELPKGATLKYTDDHCTISYEEPK